MDKHTFTRLWNHCAGNYRLDLSANDAWNRDKYGFTLADVKRFREFYERCSGYGFVDAWNRYKGNAGYTPVAS